MSAHGWDSLVKSRFSRIPLCPPFSRALYCVMIPKNSFLGVGSKLPMSSVATLPRERPSLRFGVTLPVAICSSDYLLVGYSPSMYYHLSWVVINHLVVY